MSRSESTNTPNQPVPGSEWGARLQKSCATLLYDQLSTGVISSLATGALVALTLHNMGSTSPVFFWYAAVCIVAALRMFLLRCYRHGESTPEATTFWLQMFAMSTALSGVVWGFALFLPEPNDNLQIMIALLILAGMASGSATIYAASKLVFISFNAPIVIVGACSFIYHLEFSYLFALASLYMGMVYVGGSRTCAVFAQSLNLRIENEKLIESLKTDKLEISELNAQLETRVAGRTKQLQGANTLLRKEIDQRVTAQQSLARSESLYRSLYHANPSLFVSIDETCKIESVNDYGLQFLGYEREDLVGRPISIVSHEDNVDDLLARLRECLVQGAEVQRWKTAFVDASGTRLWMRILVRSVTDTANAKHLQLVCEDVSEAHELERRLSFEASHDPLTSLYNRREFEDRLQQILNDRRLDGDRYVLCFIDLDQFKAVNDTCGHAAGDSLLRTLTTTISEYIRGNDTFARLGGDEFGILMQNTTLDDAFKLVERLRQAVETFTFVWESETFKISASFGLTEISELSSSAIDVLKEADSACYMAKQSGRNRVCVHADNAETAAQRQTDAAWIARIEHALVENQFALSLQPIVPTTTSKQTPQMSEVLLRIVDERGEISAPAAFLPAAQRCGMMSRIDRWVVDAAINYVEQHHTTSDLCCYSINLSRSSIDDDNFIAHLKDRILRSETAAEQFCFEIPEAIAVANPERVSRIVHELQSFGFQVALDDFGRGLASFDYLQSLPVNYLKIDGSFSQDIGENPVSLTLSRAVTEIAHAMGMQTVAKFVETEDAILSLKSLGVDFLQGYAVGRPELIHDGKVQQKKLSA